MQLNKEIIHSKSYGNVEVRIRMKDIIPNIVLLGALAGLILIWAVNLKLWLKVVLSVWDVVTFWAWSLIYKERIEKV